MLVNVLALAIGWTTAAVAAADASQKLENWLNDGPTPLNSSLLVDLVPLADKPGYGIGRFNIEHFWKAYVRKQSSKVVDPVLDFQELVSRHGESPDKHFKYGEILFYGVGGNRNLTRAAEYYESAANAGHGEAQFMMGVIYATGLFGNWPQDQAKATMYYTFSAMNLSTRGLMAMGNRYLRGFSAPEDYSQAYDFYLNAANSCLDYFEDFPYVGHRYDPFISFVQADEYDGGLFGDINPWELRRVSAMRELFQSFDSVQEGLDYIEFRAFEEDTTFALQYLAQANQFGITEDSRPKFDAAADLAEKLIKRVHGSTDETSKKIESWALSLLGDCYRRGEGRPFNVELAKQYYFEALEVAPFSEDFDTIKYCPQCFSGLGMIALYELRELDASSPEAYNLYKVAHQMFENGAKLSSPYSQYFLGSELYEKGLLDEAAIALRNCNHMIPLAAYTLGQIYYQKFEKTGSYLALHSAAKQMSIACKHTEELYSPSRWAHYAYRRDHESALLGFTVAAELGFTSEQVNVADILDVMHTSVEKPWLRKWPVPSYVHDSVRAPLALMYFARAGQTLSFDSLYKVAEYFYHGIGTGKQISRAFQIYETLALSYGYPMGYWATGWMYDHGINVSQSYKTAKQFYKTALESNPKHASYFAVRMSILWLYIRWWFAKLSGVDVGSISRELPNSTEKKTWLQALRDARELMKEQAPTSEPEAESSVAGRDEGTLMVDISIIAVVFIAFGVLVWFRRRRGLPA